MTLEDTWTSDPAVACYTFLPAPSPLAFWARRVEDLDRLAARERGAAEGAPEA